MSEQWDDEVCEWCGTNEELSDETVTAMLHYWCDNCKVEVNVMDREVYQILEAGT